VNFYEPGAWPGYVDEVGNIVTPDDVKQLQTAVQAEFTNLSKSIATCADKVPADYQDQWRQMRQRVVAFLKQTPSWLHTAQQMDDGQAIQRDLQPWYQLLSSWGCTPPVQPTPPPSAGGLGGIFDNIGKVLPWLVIFYVVREFRHG
jgi:hypothetical protein